MDRFSSPRVETHILKDFEHFTNFCKITVSFSIFGVERTDFTWSPTNGFLLSVCILMWSPDATLPFIVNNYVVQSSRLKQYISTIILELLNKTRFGSAELQPTTLRVF